MSESKKKEFMIDFDLPETLDAEVLKLIPAQREWISQLFYEKILMSFTLTLDRSKMWTVVEADDKAEVESILHDMPLLKWVQYTIHEVAVHEQVYLGIPQPSVN